MVVEDTLLHIKKSRKGQELPIGHVYASKCTIKIVKSKKDAMRSRDMRAPLKVRARLAWRRGKGCRLMIHLLLSRWLLGRWQRGSKSATRR